MREGNQIKYVRDRKKAELMESQFSDMEINLWSPPRMQKERKKGWNGTLKWALNNNYKSDYKTECKCKNHFHKRQCII